MFPVAKTTRNGLKMSLYSIGYCQQNALQYFVQVTQRDIPGIDASYLAMDTEEGVEVVWNEVLFSERKISEAQHVCFVIVIVKSLSTKKIFSTKN